MPDRPQPQPEKDLPPQPTHEPRPDSENDRIIETEIGGRDMGKGPYKEDESRVRISRI